VASKIDDEQRFRDERAEELRARDREREPRAPFRTARRDLTGRDALRITLVERGMAVREDGAVVASGRSRATRKSAANRPPGNPAAWVLAGGVSRHGAGCACTYCRAPAAPTDDAERGEADDTDGGGR
jgi:hypothetical protein